MHGSGRLYEGRGTHVQNVLSSWTKASHRLSTSCFPALQLSAILRRKEMPILIIPDDNGSIHPYVTFHIGGRTKSQERLARR